MISTKESAESSVDPTRSTTSIQASATVPLVTILFKEFALSALKMRLIMNILRPATVLLARTPRNSSQKPPTPVSASLNMSGSEEFAPTVTPVNIMIPTLTDVSANLATNSSMDTVNLSALLVPLTSMENACVPTECPSSKESVKTPRDVLFMLIGTRELSAVSAMLDTESLTENAAATNTAA